MTIIQIFFLLFIFFAIARLLRQFRKQHVAPWNFLLWFIFWIGVGLVVVLPNTTDVAAQLVGIGRGADLVVYLAICLLFYLLFRVFVRLEHFEQQITKLVRNIALEAHKQEQEKEKK